MGKIIKNGIEYSSAVPNLTNILHTELDAYTAEFDEKLATKTSIYTSIEQLGLTAPVTVGEIFNAMPSKTMATITCEDVATHITDIPTSYGVLTIKKNELGRFSIDYQNSLGGAICNVKKWIGTLKGNDGTELTWKLISTEPTFVTLSDMGLSSSATLQNAIDKLPKGSSAILGVKEFTNYQTIFPYEEGNDQFARVHIIKGIDDGSCVYARWFRKDGSKEAIAKFNINNNLFEGWQIQRLQQTYTELVQLGLTADATVDDVLSKLRPGETFTAGVTQFTNYQTLFPYDSSNDQYSRVFIQQGTSLATAYIKWFRKDGSREALADLDSNNKVRGWNEHTMNEIIHTSLTETLAGITTTLDLINALITEYRAKQKPVRFISGSVTKTQLTDLPSNYGLLDITVAGYDLVEARFSQSDFGFKKMHYGYLNRTSSETLFSSLSWREVNTNTILVANTANLKLDVTKKNAAWYGAIKLTYLYDTSPVEVEIDFRAVTDTLKWTISKGQKYIKKITYTQDASNKAHYTIGIEFSGITYGCYQVEVIGGFADINSLTEDAFTGNTTAVYSNPWGKNNGVTLVSAPEDIGLTSPCTTVQLVQAMRNTFNKTITSGAIGVFNNGGNTITDAPADYGLLHIEVFGHDRVMIRYDGIGGSSYNGSWIGQVVGSNGTFSSVNWSEDSNSFNKKPVKTLIIDLSASDLQSTGSSSAHLSLGNYIDKSTKVIRAEGYYNPPSDSTYPVVIPVIFGSQAGHLATDATGYTFRAVQSPSGKTGSGFAKIYYVE